MASIPSQEAVLAFIRDILEAGPADKKRKEYEELRRQSEKQQATTQDYLDDISSALALDPLAERHALSNYREWLSVNNHLERNIWVSSASQKHVLWLMATHVYAPRLARHLAFRDSALKTDPGMPGGRFWYLPGVVRESEDQLTMPVTQVLDWLLDLLSCSMDELAQMLSSSNTITGRDKGSVADTNSLRKTLRNWYTASGTPGVGKIQEYFNNQINLRFNGTFDWSNGENVDEDFRRALNFVAKKELTPRSLSAEIPIPEEEVAELLDSNEPNLSDKYDFCRLLHQRYHTPTTKTIRKRFLYARAFQATYLKLAKAIEVPKGHEKFADPALNQAIQVVSIFQTVYNLTIESCKQTDNQHSERRLFRERLENSYPPEALTTLLAVNPFSGHLQILANQLNKRMMELNDAQSTKDEVPFNLSNDRIKALYKRKGELVQACIADDNESSWLNTAPSDEELYCRINQSQNWSALNSVAGSDTIALAARRAAGWRMVEVADSEVKRVLGLVSLLAQLLNHPDKSTRPADAEQITDSLLYRLKQVSPGRNFEPLILQFEAKHELAKNGIKESKRKFDEALEDLRKRGFGDVRGEVARDALAVFASGLHAGFNLQACDQYRLTITFYGGVEGPAFSVPTTENLVKEAQEYFWENLYQPYEGYQVLRRD